MNIFKKLIPKSENTQAVLIMTFLMACAAALSYFVFSKTSLRLDEAQSLFQVSRDYAGTLFAVAQDVHVPGYHTLLQMWTFAFGNNIVAARYMSLVFFLATIPMVYILGRLVFSHKVGIFAAILVTISPFMQWYGSEARMYSMLAFMTVLHYYFFVKIYNEGKAGQWFGYILVAILGLYTHYFFGFVLLTEVLFYLLYAKSFPKGSLKKFILAAVVALAAFAPWLLYVQSLGSASNTQPALTAPSSGDVFNTYAQFLFGFQVDALNTVIVSLWPVVVLLAFFALQKNHKITQQAVFFALAAVIPVVAAFIISVTVRPFYLSRYLIVSLPPLMILLAWIFSIYPKKVRRILQVALVILTLGLLAIQVLNPQTPVKEDYKEAVGYLNQTVTAQDVVVVAAPFTVYPTEYYYNGAAKLTTQPIWDRFQGGGVPGYDASKVKEETDRNVLPYQYAYVMLSYDQGYNEKLKTYYDSRFERVMTKDFSDGLTVYKYRISYDPKITITPAPLTP
jgi:mannosyltransferase